MKFVISMDRWCHATTGGTHDLGSNLVPVALHP